MHRIQTFFFIFFMATTASADTQRGIDYFNTENFTAAEHEFLGPVAAGDPTAIRYYANMLYFGRGVAQDRSRAKDLLRMAYNNGDTASGAYLASLLTDYWTHFTGAELTPEDLARLSEAKVLIEETYTSPNNQGPAGTLVDIFIDTEGQIAPKASIILWFKRAVLEGHNEAAWQLANAYATGNGVEMNESDAFYWAEYAAFLEHPEAQTVVGQIYAEGRYGPIRRDEAMALIVQSAKHRHNPAMLHVAEYFTNEGLNRDLGMAWRVLNLAYDRGMEKSDRSQKLSDYLLSRGAADHAQSINDSAYNALFEELIQSTTPDYQTALKDFSDRLKPHSE